MSNLDLVNIFVDNLIGGQYFCKQVTYKFQNCRSEKDCRFWLIFGVDCTFENFYETLLR